MKNIVRAVLLSLALLVALFIASVMTLGLYGFLFVIIAPLLLGACIALHLRDGVWFLPGAELGALPAFVVFHRIRT